MGVGGGSWLTVYSKRKKAKRYGRKQLQTVITGEERKTRNRSRKQMITMDTEKKKNCTRRRKQKPIIIIMIVFLAPFRVKRAQLH